VLEYPALPSLKLPSLMTNSSIEKSSHVITSPRPPSQPKQIPLKMSVHFPITITVSKHWSNFVTSSLSPLDSEGVSRVNVGITGRIGWGHETIVNRSILTFWTSFLTWKTTANSPLWSYSGPNILVFIHIELQSFPFLLIGYLKSRICNSLVINLGYIFAY